MYRGGNGSGERFAQKALYVKGAAGRRYRVVNCLGEEIENGIISAPLQEIVVPMSGILFTEE